MVQLYKGDLLPKEIWKILQTDSNSILIDVRTEAEWHYVGEPLLSKVIKLQWRLLPDMRINESFIPTLLNLVADKETILCFLCRLGGRSMEAAISATQHGYINCYNVLHGFEGDLDEKGQRGKISGWKADQLPWRQD